MNKGLFDLSKKIISYDTVSNKENVSCSEYIADYLDGFGFKVDLYRDHMFGDDKAQIVASIGPANGGNGIILSGHLDIVPFENQPGWVRDPLVLTLEDDKLFGRGTSDMKVFITQALVALKKINLQKLKSQLVFILTCDEEICCQGAKRLVPILKEGLSERPLPSQALVGEPTDFKVFHAHKGIGVFHLITTGVAGHSSRPDRGTNAITDMTKIINVIDKVNDELISEKKNLDHDLYPQWPYCSINIGRIFGGVADNMIPERCEIQVSVRSTLQNNADTIIARIKEEIGKLNLKGLVSWEGLLTAPALRSSDQTEAFKFLSSYYNQSQVVGAPYVTDAGHFSDLGIDSYICGPGSLSQAHMPNESIQLSHFESGVDMIQALIEKMCL
ncbi:MAG: M20 family metallopeptidase [Bacteriovoracaceae bacterium]|nr:M20 family metallopeptidase [Bacteriovoracaceae bacterium]